MATLFRTVKVFVKIKKYVKNSQIKFVTKKVTGFKSLRLSYRKITQVIKDCQMSVSLI